MCQFLFFLLSIVFLFCFFCSCVFFCLWFRELCNIGFVRHVNVFIDCVGLKKSFQWFLSRALLLFSAPVFRNEERTPIIFVEGLGGEFREG